MDNDLNAAPQSDQAGARVGDETVPVGEQATDGDGLANAAPGDAEPDEQAFEQSEGDLTPAEAAMDAKARARADWVARVREHAPSLLADAPKNVSTPWVTEPSVAAAEDETESVSRAPENAVEALSDTADLPRGDTPEGDHEARLPLAAPAPKSPDAPSAATVAAAHEPSQRSDVAYSLAASPPSRAGASRQSGEREPPSDARPSARASDRADAVEPIPAVPGQTEPRADNAGKREEVGERSSMPLLPASAAPETHARGTRIDGPIRLPEALYEPTANLTAFASPSPTAPPTHSSQIPAVGDDVAPTAAFPPLLVNGRGGGDPWITSQSRSSAGSTTNRMVDATEPTVVLGSAAWPSLPETDVDLEDSDDVTGVLRARDRWARLVREQESA